MYKTEIWPLNVADIEMLANAAESKGLRVVSIVPMGARASGVIVLLLLRVEEPE